MEEMIKKNMRRRPSVTSEDEARTPSPKNEELNGHSKAKRNDENVSNNHNTMENGREEEQRHTSSGKTSHSGKHSNGTYLNGGIPNGKSSHKKSNLNPTQPSKELQSAAGRNESHPNGREGPNGHAIHGNDDKLEPSDLQELNIPRGYEVKARKSVGNTSNESDETIEAHSPIVRGRGSKGSIDEFDEKKTDKTLASIYVQYKVAKSINAHLPVTQVILLARVCKSWGHAVKTYYANAIDLDLSEFYGVLGSPQFNSKTFFNEFLPLFNNVQSLSVRYCTHLKARNLERILGTINQDIHLEEEEEDGSEESDEEEPGEELKENTKLERLNLYFCKSLRPRALWNVARRCPNLNELNIGRCHGLTADKNINGLKALVKLPLRKLTLSLDPSVTHDEASEILGLLSHEDSFRELEVLDISHGCEQLIQVGLAELQDRNTLTIIAPLKRQTKKPKKKKRQSSGEPPET